MRQLHHQTNKQNRAPQNDAGTTAPLNDNPNTCEVFHATPPRSESRRLTATAVMLLAGKHPAIGQGSHCLPLPAAGIRAAQHGYMHSCGGAVRALGGIARAFASSAVRWVPPVKFAKAVLPLLSCCLQASTPPLGRAAIACLCRQPA